MLSVLQQNLAKAQSSMKKYANRKRTPRTFLVGDMVYLKMQPYREKDLGSGTPLKLASKWYGPFKILQAVGNRAYRLQLPEGTQIHDVFHVNQLKKHLGARAVPNTQLHLVTPEGKLKSTPKAMLQRRHVPRNAGEYAIAVPQWLVQWEEMSPEEATWEDATFMQSTFPSFKPRGLVFRGEYCQDLYCWNSYRRRPPLLQLTGLYPFQLTSLYLLQLMLFDFTSTSMLSAFSDVISYSA
jgi:hypothetical protein